MIPRARAVGASGCADATARWRARACQAAGDLCTVGCRVAHTASAVCCPCLGVSGRVEPHQTFDKLLEIERGIFPLPSLRVSWYARVVTRGEPHMHIGDTTTLLRHLDAING